MMLRKKKFWKVWHTVLVFSALFKVSWYCRMQLANAVSVYWHRWYISFCQIIPTSAWLCTQCICQICSHVLLGYFNVAWLYVGCEIRVCVCLIWYVIPTHARSDLASDRLAGTEGTQWDLTWKETRNMRLKPPLTNTQKVAQAKRQLSQISLPKLPSF